MLTDIARNFRIRTPVRDSTAISVRFCYIIGISLGMNRYLDVGCVRQLQKRDLCLPHLHSTPPPVRGRDPSEYCHDTWYGKTGMVWLHGGEKNVDDIMITRFDRMHERDRQTDRHRMTA